MKKSTVFFACLCAMFLGCADLGTDSSNQPPKTPPPQCLVNDDCRPSEVCTDQVCVPKDPPGTGGAGGEGNSCNCSTGGSPPTNGGSGNVAGTGNVGNGGSGNTGNEPGNGGSGNTGNEPGTGGSDPGVGGQPPATGGTPPATGGKPGVGGAPPATGGTPPATGGKPGTGGSSATGGKSGTGSTCGKGGASATGGTPPCTGCGCEQRECDELKPCKGKLTCDLDKHECVPIEDCDEVAADCRDECTITYNACVSKSTKSGVRLQCITTNPCLSAKTTCLEKCESTRLKCGVDSTVVMDCKDGTKCGKDGQPACPPKGMATYCHLPRGNPDHPITITTSYCALDAHFSPTVDEKDIGHRDDYFGRCLKPECENECSEACYSTPGGKSPWRGWTPGKK